MLHKDKEFLNRATIIVLRRASVCGIRQGAAITRRNIWILIYAFLGQLSFVFKSHFWNKRGIMHSNLELAYIPNVFIGVNLTLLSLLFSNCIIRHCMYS
jgi:hypothetical protein